MESHGELARLKAVYREYGELGWCQTKWALTNKGNQAIQEERQHKLEQLLRHGGLLPLADKRILDVGCDTGEVLESFTAWGASPKNLFGVDLLADRVERAKEKFPRLTFQQSNAEALPFADRFFDLVALFTVFTSILDSGMAGNVGREVDRVLRPGGAVLWYDFRMNNPLNRHVRGISRARIQRLFPGFDARLVSLTLLPPLARRCGCLTGLLYPCLAGWPFLRSHYLGVLRKP